MADRVKGWVTPWGVDDAIRHGGEIVLRKNEIKPLGTIQATLVVTDERLFTESEVKAIIEQIVKHVEGYYFDRAEIAEMVSRHGIVLDPA